MMELIRNVADHARRRPDAVAYREITNTPAAARTLTYAQLAGAVNEFAAGVRGRFAAGATLVIRIPNTCDYPVAFLGTLAAGCAAFPVPADVAELLSYFEPVQPGQAVQAVPGPGVELEVWILGSSLFGAQFAARLGLPYAFASHFAPTLLEQAIAVYRAGFRPSSRLAQPHVMLALNAVVADTDGEAARLFTTQQQAFANLRSGRPGLVPPPLASLASCGSATLGKAAAALHTLLELHGARVQCRRHSCRYVASVPRLATTYFSQPARPTPPRPPCPPHTPPP